VYPPRLPGVIHVHGANDDSGVVGPGGMEGHEMLAIQQFSFEYNRAISQAASFSMICLLTSSVCALTYAHALARSAARSVG
jgi:hypothetical protein